MDHMTVSDFFPMWNQLEPIQQLRLSGSAAPRTIRQGTVIHRGSTDCVGLLLILSGQLRGYILSDEGREITIYRLFERDICLLSASCIMNSIQFEITIEAEKDTEVLIIPPDVYKEVMEQSAPIANYTREIMSSRFSDVMWLIEQVMWKSMDRRLAAFLLEESALEGSSVLTLTHEKIGNHMGTAREVVTRMLRYFQSDGMVKLTRGKVEITDAAGLSALAD